MTVLLIASHYIYANTLVDMGDYEEALIHAERANAIAQEIGFPVVLKVLSPDILHKTEAKVVKLDIFSEEGLRKGYSEM